MKLREELETVVGDGLLLLRVLDQLGFRVWFRYQKYREEFAHEDVTVADRRNAGGHVRGNRRQRARHPGDGRRAGAQAQPTTCSIRTAACSSNIANVTGCR